MIGILLVTHANLGQALIETLEFISEKKETNLSAVSINIQEDPETLRKKIKKAISDVKTDNGVLILTDMFGGTPSNLSYSFLEEGRVEVISGVNLPILFRAVNSRSKMKMEALTSVLVEHGKKSISLASDILKGTKRA
ncbi:MAG: PTS fructose transporter subunit IIA [Desulfobacula sp. RIFOXYA12_FULL_46_16]|jgi:PTS system mannose-specific IIA component|nr:MAG: PTS fructose transporter subunit IIA [Deltaproteobacteria bacterium RIFOXYC2_FULL_48_10]OGR21134.1 MAG: PTS fructose transporter subunit IIA [Desulfobacula sp. RIFOXYA12_FULL_46_16]